MTETTTLDSAELRRFLQPKSVALVGLSESVPRHAVTALKQSGIETVAIHPRHSTVWGLPAYPDLAAVGSPIDSVLSLVNARASIEIVRQAVALGVGGVIVNAAGFSEVGPEGADLQRSLCEAAGPMPVLGPNCNGFVNVLSGAFLSAAPNLPLRPGSIGIISHSGGFITDLSVSAVERRVGFSSLISTGNEAVTDLVDYLSYFVDDEQTAAIGLVVESIRRPREFFREVLRAHRAGKPIVALKMGRSQQGQRVAASHTGAIIGEGWVYEAAFRQHGVGTARDLADLLDQLSLFDQWDRSRWSAVAKPAVLSVSGGAATLASDVCEDEGLVLNGTDELASGVRALLPQTGSINPIDMTGFVMKSPELLTSVFETYASSPDVDTLVGLWTLGLPERDFADAFLLPFVAVAERSGKPFVLSAIADAPMSKWAEELGSTVVAVQHGLRATVRGLTAIRDFVAFVPDDSHDDVSVIASPEAGSIVDSGEGRMLRFADTMTLLAKAGIPIAPYQVLAERDDVHVTAPGVVEPFVVKIADCAHRTDIGGVRLNVAASELVGVVGELRDLAGRRGLPRDIVVQPQLRGTNESFVGAQVDALGPVVVCGMAGGVHIEAMGTVRGRLAPFGRNTAMKLARDADPAGLFTGARGAEPLDISGFAELLVNTSRLVAGANGWLASLDLNPVLAVDGAYVAVDGLVFLRG